MLTVTSPSRWRPSARRHDRASSSVDQVGRVTADGIRCHREGASMTETDRAFRVLDLTTTLGGAYAAHLLSSGGVDVDAGRPAGRPPAAALERERCGRSRPARRVRCSSGSPAASRRVTVDPASPADVDELLAWAATFDVVLWSPDAVVDLERARGGGAGRDDRDDHAVRAARAVGRPGGHRVHAAGAVGRARPARVAGVAADVVGRAARRVHAGRVRRRRRVRSRCGASSSPAGEG